MKTEHDKAPSFVCFNPLSAELGKPEQAQCWTIKDSSCSRVTDALSTGQSERSYQCSMWQTQSLFKLSLDFYKERQCPLHLMWSGEEEWEAAVF